MKRSYDDDLVIWLAGGERGISSNTIVEHLTGLPALGRGWDRSGPCHPHDPDDLRRCLLLLEAVPAFKSRFYEMQGASKKWNALTVHIEELTRLMSEEVPNWKGYRATGSAPKTYARMKEIYK